MGGLVWNKVFRESHWESRQGRIPRSNRVVLRYSCAPAIHASTPRFHSGPLDGVKISIGVHKIYCSGSKTYHILPTLHEFLVNDLASKVLACLDVYRFFDDSICPTSEGFTCPILQECSINAPVNDRR